VTTFTNFGQATSSEHATWMVAGVMKNGAPGIVFAIGNGLMLMPIYWFTNRWWRRIRTLTLADFFIERYCTVAWGFVPLLALVLYGNTMTNPDLIWGHMVKDLLGPLGLGLVGLMVVCMLGALMSTADTLQKRIEKYRDDLIRFVTHPDVEFHNNRAERQLRPMVIGRKVSFGSNTHRGALRHCILKACHGWLRAQVRVIFRIAAHGC